jgi:hypothetical protein
MHRHGPSCLEGPVTWTRDWWYPEEDMTPELPPASEQRTDKIAPEQPFRSELVERVRREIAEGTYETPEKWDIALQRLFEKLEGERGA